MPLKHAVMDFPPIPGDQQTLPSDRDRSLPQRRQRGQQDGCDVTSPPPPPQSALTSTSTDSRVARTTDVSQAPLETLLCCNVSDQQCWGAFSSGGWVGLSGALRALHIWQVLFYLYQNPTGNMLVTRCKKGVRSASSLCSSAVPGSRMRLLVLLGILWWEEILGNLAAWNTFSVIWSWTLIWFSLQESCFWDYSMCNMSLKFYTSVENLSCTICDSGQLQVMKLSGWQAIVEAPLYHWSPQREKINHVWDV